MDFFERTSEYIKTFNETDRKLFEYVVRNIHHVKDMQIRVLAAECFVSTTTILRFTKKLGFEGYRNFKESVWITCQTLNTGDFPEVAWKRTYSEDYLKNLIETVRVLSDEKIKQFRLCLEKRPAIYFFGTELDKEVAHYAYRLITSMGYHTYFLSDNYEVDAAVNQLGDGDVLFLFSLSGEEKAVLRLVEQARVRCKPIVISVTQSANNMLQNMSDIDLYVFVDYFKYNNLDFSSRVSMIAIVELLVYSLLAKKE